MSETYRSVELFAGLDEQHLAQIGVGARDVSFAAGQLVARRGGDADTFFVIERGSVALEIHAPGAGSFVVETLGAGSVLGWSWLFPPYRWQFDVRALDTVSATAFDGSRVRQACDRDPALGYELMSRFARLIVERLQFTRLRLLDVYGHGRR